MNSLGLKVHTITVVLHPQKSRLVTISWLTFGLPNGSPCLVFCAESISQSLHVIADYPKGMAEVEGGGGGQRLDDLLRILTWTTPKHGRAET